MPAVKKTVDVSHPFMEKTPVYAGDPIPHTLVVTTIVGAGYNLFNLFTNNLYG